MFGITQFTILHKIIAALLILLSFATLAAYLLQRFHPEKDFHDLKQRITPWWIILPLFSLALILNGPIFSLLMMFVCFLGFKEFISAIPTRLSDRKTIFLLYLAIPFQFYFAWKHSFEAFICFIPIIIFLLIGFMTVLTQETAGFLSTAANLNLGFILIVFSISHIVYLSTFGVSAKLPVGGAGAVLYLAILTELNDVSQYCCGKLFGHKKIMPLLSPNKTVAGFVGGILTSTLISIPLSSSLLAFSLNQAVVCGILISLGGFFGDVFFSGIKRDLDIKDFGSWIPGHGGILDRIDSLTVSAPLFFHFLRIIYLGVQI